MLIKLAPPTLVVISLLFSPMLFAKSHYDSFSEKVMSCGEMLEKIRHSDCGNHIIDIFTTGYISGGAAGYSLSASPKFEYGAAEFSGGFYITPHISLSTGLQFFPGTDLGWDYTIGWEQAHALTQTVRRSGEKVTKDLGTFAIANTFSSEVSVFYAYGARDSTPRRYASFGVGFGLGYADMVGKAYLTEDLGGLNPACSQAGEDLVDNAAGAKDAIANDCELKSFRRVGLGISGRINFDVRYDNFFLSIDSKLVNLSSGRSLSIGSSGIELNPIISAITLSYLFNL